MAESFMASYVYTFLAFLGFTSLLFRLRRLRHPIQSLVVTPRMQIGLFCIGLASGIFFMLMIDYAYGIDWKNANSLDVYTGLTAALLGYWGFYAFTAYAMILALVMTIPYTAARIGHLWYIPFSRGVTFGFGSVVFYHLLANGLPKLF